MTHTHGDLFSFAKALQHALVEARVDAALCETFPCSDPIATSCIEHRADEVPDHHLVALCIAVVTQRAQAFEGTS